jgi:plastocyanin
MLKIAVITIFTFLIFHLPQSTLAKDQVIEMTKDSFSPSQVQVNQSDQITFKNSDLAPHWPASNIHPSHIIYPEFDPKKAIEPGQSWTFKFDKAGTWRFHDHLNPNITGTVVVQATSPLAKNKTLDNSNFLENLKSTMNIFYYKIFPKKLEQRLNAFKITTIKEVDEKELTLLLRAAGKDQVMEKLLKDSGNGKLVDCHQPAHTIGRNSYKIYGAKAFLQIKFDCNSGFIHGAMEQFLVENGTTNLASKIQALCDKFTTSFSKFECLHGVGHGVMAYEDYDLPESLGACQNLSDTFAKQSCYGGVFMENIIASQGQGGLWQHQTKWVSNDPFFPCNSMGQEFQFQCYLMQTSRMLTLEKYDFKKVGELCNQLDEQKTTCFQSLGRDISGYTLNDSLKTDQLCQLVPSDSYQDCLKGALYVVIDLWGTRLTTQASALCQVVKDDSKNTCFRFIGLRLPGIFGQDEERTVQACASPNQNDQATCLNTARTSL